MPNSTDMKHNKMINDFFQKSTSEQLQLFNRYSLEEQYELFLFGNQVVHPPAVYLSQPFAEQGPIIVPFLKSKLETTQKEVTIRDIIAVFHELAGLKLYNFSEDPDLLGLIERKANKMDGIWKETTLKLISEIQSKEP